MKLVYSLYSGVNSHWLQGDFFETTLKYFELSIRLARQYHHIVLYTDEVGKSRLGHLVDEVKLLERTPDYVLWSESQIEAISREEGQFLHIDGDVLLHDKLYLPKDVDIYYEHIEVGLYDRFYRPKIKLFSERGIQDHFPEWSTEDTGIFNIGIVGFNSEEAKKIYLDRYYSNAKWYKSTLLNELGIYDHSAAMVLQQHSLTCIAKYHNFTSASLFTYNEYIHMFGRKKYRKMNVCLIESYMENYNFKNLR